MDISWVLTIIIGLLATYLLYTKVLNTKSYWEKRGVFSLKISPITINYRLLFPNKSIADNVKELYKKHEGKKYLGYEMVNTPILFIRDPEIINLVLVHDFSYFQDRQPMNSEKELVHSGLASITGDKWRILRLKLTPSFTSGKMKIMFKQIKESSDDIVKFIKANGEDIETKDFLFNCMLNVISSIGFGINAGALKDKTEKENDFVKMSKTLSKPTLLLYIKFIFLLLTPRLTKLFGLKLTDNAVNKFFPNFIHGLIEHRKQNNEKRNDFLQFLIDLQEKEKAQINSLNSSEYKDYKSFIDYSINGVKDVQKDKTNVLPPISNYNIGEPLFSDHIIAAQAFLFVSAGSETTSTVLSFLLHYLAVHHDVQRKLQDEIEDSLLSYGFSYETVTKKLKYLDQILYEVLRLRSPGGIITRVCTQNYRMPGTDLIIEKGTIIQVPVSALHTDPQYFPDPEKFNPDRFEDMDSIPKGVFFPFGNGPRMCTAVRLAMLMMKVIVVTLLTTYNIAQSEKTPLPLKMCKRSFAQHVVGGLWIKFEERKKPTVCH